MEELANDQDVGELEEVPMKLDPYTRKAKDKFWRTRNSLKLLQIDEMFGILKGVKRAVDLQASPGVWTQVLSRKLAMGETVLINDKYCLFYNEHFMHRRAQAKEVPKYKQDDDVVIVAVDPCGLPPFSGVVQIEGDLCKYSTAENILEQFRGKKAELVVCHKLVNFSGLQFIDINFQSNHVIYVLHIACHILQTGGTLVVAVFNEPDTDFIKLQLSTLFKEVNIFRPKCSKVSVKESFAICRHYSPPEGFDPKLMIPYLDFSNKDFTKLTGVNRMLIPFLIYGDVSVYPVSLEDEQLYNNLFALPLSLADPGSDRIFKKEEFNQCLEMATEAMKIVGLEHDPDLEGMELIEKINVSPDSSCEAQNALNESLCKDQSVCEDLPIYDNGPLYDLIQKTTKIKNYPCEEHNLSDESELQFLYEDEHTDPEIIRECLERVNPTIRSSTCTCAEF